MPLLEDVANRVAERTLKLIETTGDEDLEKKVADQIGASSPTLQEAFTTALRILKAEARAARYIDGLEGKAPPVTPSPAPPVEPQAAPEPVVQEEPEVIPETELLDHTIILGDGTSDADDLPDFDQYDDEVMALPSPSS